MTKSLMKKTLVVAMSAAFAAGAAAENNPARGSGDYHWDSLDKFDDMDLSGQTVTVAGPWLAPENATFNAVLSYFEDATGADVQYSGSDSFEQQIRIDLQAGSPPNLAIFPQPGLAADMASQGLLEPLSNDLRDIISDDFAASQSWIDLGTYADESGDDQFYGIFYRVNVKSLVWYSPDNFADYGYDVPESMEELIELSDQMVADGVTPWCIGLGSGAATGWPATDWVEDMMLRVNTPAVYDQWVNHEIPFNDPRVVEAIELFGKFAKNDDYVQGGAQAVASTDFRESVNGLFSIPPGCFMHRQADFASSFFPEDSVMGEDVDFFYLPSYDSKDLGNPVLGAGTIVAMPKENEAAAALMEYLTTPLAQEIWMAEGGFLTPHTGVNNDLFASETQRRQAEILQNADTFRFDGSDLMPGGVGAGAFWTGMVDYVSGDSAEDVADDIESAWENL